MGFIREWLVLSRLQTAGLTALAPVFGLIAADGWRRENLGPAGACFAIGLCVHVHAFVANELADLGVDARHPELGGKPLVKGTISREGAWNLCIGSAAGAYLIGALAFPNLWMLWALVVSNIFGDIYNFRGKTFPGSDIFLSLWAMVFCIFGAFAALVPDGVSWTFLPWPLPGAVYWIGFLGALQVFFNNAIEGGLKDVPFDTAAGAKTLVTRVFGATVEGDTLLIPARLQSLGRALKLVTFFCFIGALVSMEGSPSVCQWVAGILVGLGMALTLGSFLRDRVSFDRSLLKRKFSRHEFLTYLLVPIALSPATGFKGAIFLAILPIIWFLVCNRVLYGTWMEPRV